MLKDAALKTSFASPIVFVCLLMSASPAFSAGALEPKTVYGVIAGVLSWKDLSFSTYSVTNRKDKELYDAFIARAFIHYAGYESSWDEWAGAERLNCGR